MLLYIATIAAVDSLNPTTIALQIYLLSTRKPVVRCVTFIFGVFTAYFTTGLLFALGLSRVIMFITNAFLRSGDFMYVIRFIIGVLLIIVGCKINQLYDPQKISKRPRVHKPINTFVLGFAVTFSDAPTALPYVAAIERIVRAKLDFHEFISVLVFYNLIFVFPLIVLLGIYIVLQKKASALINTIVQQFMKWSPKIFQILSIGFGLWLVIDCIVYTLKRLLIS